MTSSMTAGATPDRTTASVTARVPSSRASTSTNVPLWAVPIGVRAVAMITASWVDPNVSSWPLLLQLEVAHDRRTGDRALVLGCAGEQLGRELHQAGRSAGVGRHGLRRGLRLGLA